MLFESNLTMALKNFRLQSAVERSMELMYLSLIAMLALNGLVILLAISHAINSSRLDSASGIVTIQVRCSSASLFHSQARGFSSISPPFSLGDAVLFCRNSPLPSPLRRFSQWWETKGPPCERTFGCLISGLAAT